MGLDVLKSYLVKLGFDTDDSSFAKFKKTLNDSTAYVEGSTTGMTRSYVKAAGAIAGALTSIGIGTISLLDKLATQDMEYQKFAMHMFMGRDAAKQMKIATDALGESLDDISWNPELRKRYFDLIRQERAMSTPKSDQAQLKYLRDIRFEFTRLKVEATYGLQWVGHYLFQYLAGPIKNIREGMGKLNDWIQEKMPEWSDKIARGLTYAINIGEAVWRVIKKVYDGLKLIWDELPENAKMIALALGVAFAPISPALKVMTLLVALVDDFYAYLDGRKSSTTLAPIWSNLIKATDLITWNLVLATAMLDNFFKKMNGEKSQSFSQVYSEVQEAYDDSVAGREGKQKKDRTKKTLTPLQSRNEDMRGSSWYKYTPVLSWLADVGANYREEQELKGEWAAMPASPFLGQSVPNVKYQLGDIIVNVNQSNATAKEIGAAVKQNVLDSLDKAHARQIREMGGAFH
jgi:hypothetical protein